MIKSIDTLLTEYLFIETVCDDVYDIVCAKHNVYVCDIPYVRLVLQPTLVNNCSTNWHLQQRPTTDRPLRLGPGADDFRWLFTLLLRWVSS